MHMFVHGQMMSQFSTLAGVQKRRYHKSLKITLVQFI